MSPSNTTTDETERATTMSEQMNELNQNVRELRDEALLKPVAAAMESVGVETADIDDTSEDISLIDNAAAMLAGPVLASHGMVLGFYIGARLTNTPDIAAVAGIASGLLLGVAGLVVGFRYLDSNTERPADAEGK